MSKRNKIHDFMDKGVTMNDLKGYRHKRHKGFSVCNEINSKS